MDPFTQKMLERAEQRSKAFGISGTSKFPLGELNQHHETSPTRTVSTFKPSPTKQVALKTSADQDSHSPRHTKRITNNTDAKENCDVELEINITSESKIEVQVEVEEREIDADGNILSSRQLHGADDAIKTRLKQLANNKWQSDNFDDNAATYVPVPRRREEMPQVQLSPKKEGKFSRFAALASSINNWEDDLSHADAKHVREITEQSPKRNSSGRQSRKKSPAPLPPTFRMKERAPSPPKVEEATVKTCVIDNKLAEYAVPQLHTKENLKQRECSRSPPVKPRAVSPLPERDSQTVSKCPQTVQQRDVSRSPLKSRRVCDPQQERERSPTKLNWDYKMMNSLENQGFQRRDSNEKVEKPKKSTAVENERRKSPAPRTHPEIVGTLLKASPEKHEKNDLNRERMTSAANNRVDNTANNIKVAQRAAMFESKIPAQKRKDPAEMSLKERMALFEKNKGNALMPKAPLTSAPPQFQRKPSERPKVAPPQIPSSPPVDKKPANSAAAGSNVKNVLAALMSNSTTISESQISENVRQQRQQEMDILMNRFNNQKAINGGALRPTAPVASPPPPPPPMPLPRKSLEAAKNISTVANPMPVDAHCMINNKRRSGDEVEQHEKVNTRIIDSDIKRIKVNPTMREGRLYPVLSDMEIATTTATTTPTTVSSDESEQENDRLLEGHNERPADGEDSEMMDDSCGDGNDSTVGFCDMSLGREILKMVRRNEQGGKSPMETDCGNKSYMDSSGDNSGIVDDYLDEAFDSDESDSDNEQKPNPRSGTLCSDSFHYQNKASGRNKCKSIEEDEVEYRTPVKSELKVNPEGGDDSLVTLVHTVSFYRRQQSASNSPAVRASRPVTYNPANDVNESVEAETTESKNDEQIRVQEKVKSLLDEVCKQQQIISQASQALNLCAATIEFSGSTEAVEGERLLLVATHRRQSALDEIQRLRNDRKIRPTGAPTERGRLVVKDITIPLNHDYIAKLSNDSIAGHNLVCLLKYNEHVLHTKTMPTLPGLKAVQFPDILQMANVYADFNVTIEIYGMKAQRELLPHNVKYHINFKSPKKTPKKSNKKAGTPSNLIMPPVQSPAGPNAVRSPALMRYASLTFNLRDIRKNQFTLTPAAGCGGASPLLGVILMRATCELSMSVDYRGFLTMFEDVSGFGAWHRRWCRIHGNQLSYWKYPDDEKKRPPIGSIDLNTCHTSKVKLAPRDVCARLNTLLLECKRPRRPDDQESLVIVQQGQHTVVRHLLSADTKEERDEWGANINKALVMIRSWGPQASS